MPHYKDLSDKLHFLDSADFEHLLPAGCVAITEAEADAIANPPPTAEQVKATRTAEIKAALVEIDFKSIRPLREGDAERVASFKAQAESLRKELESL